MARKTKKASKKTTRAAPTLAPLDNPEAQAQLSGLVEAASNFIDVVNDKTTLVPVGHIRKEFTTLAREFRATMKGRKVDPTEKKKISLAAKIRKFQLELEAINKSVGDKNVR